MKSSRCFAIPPIDTRLFSVALLLFASSTFLFSDVEAFNLPGTVAFDNKFTHVFGGDRNLVRSSDGNGVRLHLDRSTGSGFNSSSMHQNGFFSANIKLPSGHTAGIVVAFYTTNGDKFIKNHDELDIEFLGNVEGKPWRIQTNLYGNGSTKRGREERFRLWFDPSKEFHRYSILWTTNRIIFYVDDVPIREVVRSEAMGNDYPSKPMSLYATIWDASDWASCGGKCKTDYKYAPFVAEFKDLLIEGCPVKPSEQLLSSTICSEMNEHLESQDYAIITPNRRAAMRKFRQRFMYYSYCYDKRRYPVALPECVIDSMEKQRFKEDGQLKFESSHRRRRNRNRKTVNIPEAEGSTGVSRLLCCD